MERLSALAEGLTQVAWGLAEDVLEPDASRTDWTGATARVDLVRQGMEAALASVEGALEEAEDEASKALVRQRTAEMAGRLAALLFATGDTPGGRLWLERALHLAQAPAQRAKLEAGLRDPAHFNRYEHAVWAQGRGRSEVARGLLKRVVKGTRQKTLKELAREGLRASAPRVAPRRSSGLAGRVVRGWPWLLLVGFVGAFVWAGRSAPRDEEQQARQDTRSSTEADGLVKEWPLRALALYTQVSGEGGRDAAREIIDSFGEAPSLWLEAEDSVEAWLDRGDVRVWSTESFRYRARLAQAHSTHAKNEKLIARGDEAALAEASKDSPGDQELAVAVARLRLARGEAAEARALLQALGPLGRLTGEARVLLADCHRAQGELAEADAVLSAFVAERIGPLQAARRRYEQRAQEVNVKEDPQLEKLHAAYLRHQPVVSAALTLGLVKLQRASGESGQARTARLGEAERVFLSIQREAENKPRVLLGLGQVYHWLGRVEEGDVEFNRLVKRGDPELTLEVAEVYRELGQQAQARDLAEGVYNTARSKAMKYAAAQSMWLLASSDDEREAWLLKGDTTSEMVQEELIELRARRAAQAGRFEEADALLAQYVALNVEDAKHSSGAANNIALALKKRFRMTGHPEHLELAVSHLEAALRLAPDNAVVVGNLADVREYLGHVSVLERWVHTRVLRPSPEDAERLVDVLLEGPLRAEVQQALNADPSLRRGQELAQQEQILAPGKPDGWKRSLRWLTQRRDTEGLEVLARRLKILPSVGDGPPDEDEGDTDEDEDSTDEDSTQEDADSTDGNEPYDQHLAQEDHLVRARLTRAEQAKHAPTLAAAWLLLGDAQRRQYMWRWSPRHLDGWVEASRQTLGHWAPLGQNRTLDEALLLVALKRGATKSEALARVWRAKRYDLGPMALLHHVMRRPDGAQLVRVLREQPELREAVESARRRIPSGPVLEDWVLAKVAGDAVLERAAAGVFSRPDLKLSLSLHAYLEEGQGDAQAMRALFQQAQAAQTVP